MPSLATFLTVVLFGKESEEEGEDGTEDFLEAFFDTGGTWTGGASVLLTAVILPSSSLYNTSFPFLYRTPHALHKVFGPSGPARHNGVSVFRQCTQRSRREVSANLPMACRKAGTTNEGLEARPS